MNMSTQKPSLVEGIDLDYGCISYADAEPGVLPVELWHGLFLGAVTQYNGEPGSGKSSFLRALALNAALDRPFLDIPFGLGRPLKVLYFDRENLGDVSRSDGGLTVARLDALTTERTSNLLLHNGYLGEDEQLDLSNPAHCKALAGFIRQHRVDLLILDPYISIVNVQNENDNAEANRIGRRIKRLAQTTGCAIIVAHHTGKYSEENGNQKGGRGASALFAVFDNSYLFRSRRCKTISDEKLQPLSLGARRDVSKIEAEKVRYSFCYSPLFLQMDGTGGFDPITEAQYNRAGEGMPREVKKERQEANTRAAILKCLEDGEEHDRQELLRTLKVTRPTLDDAIKSLLAEAKISERTGERGKQWFSLAEANPHSYEASATPDGPKIVRGRPHEKQ